ncbi:HAD family phosphatase [Nitratireductor sp. ZSWI3]|uniref:HAD family hydrolase n=1 Tax=Nitratireductor sp. ZSWI3 TaxID=2966359 RepID=UPI00214FAA9E|nr:HAD family hydrolase [Nitratireductor sp. ZSWI3]MCR4265017.1 HAD family hydrolase [Nitratireductor sp. ZSWI3]
MGSSTIDLVIFDCDGVLVDSEPLSMRVLLETVSESGITIDEDKAYELFLGRSLSTITSLLKNDYAVDLDAGQLERMRTKLYAAFRAELQPVDGIGEALDGLSRPCCVASSSQPERIRLSLGVAGLLERFEPHIFSATMVANGKPAPDLFLHAARTMGVEPRRCAVVEDSPAGLEAARRAGMRVLCFAGASHAGSEAHRAVLRRLEPDLIFDRMRTLPEHLARLEETTQH